MQEVKAGRHLGVNQVCRYLSVSKTAYYYQPKKRKEDMDLESYLTDLASQHKRWGFDKMMAKAKLDQRGWNHKRVRRVYRELGLNLRVKPRKRIPSGEAKSLLQPLYANMCWSMDFMTDVLSSGFKFRTLNVLDDFNREGLLIKPAFSLTAKTVIAQLDQLAMTRGYPDMIRVDNGPEFRSTCFRDWAEEKGILVHFIQPGKPNQNGYVERFNRTYREDILDMNIFDSLNEVERYTSEWLQMYNSERPHESLGGLTPELFAAWREQVASSE